MKIFSEPSARPPLKLAKAWTCLFVNALVCPGLGSVMGRRWIGLPQLVLAWGGAIWMALPMGRYFSDWVANLEHQPDWRPYFQTALAGLAFFLAAWVWSIGTGILLVRSARHAPAPPANLPPRTSGP